MEKEKFMDPVAKAGWNLCQNRAPNPPQQHQEIPGQAPMTGNAIPKLGIGFGYCQWLLLPPSHGSPPHSQVETLWNCPGAPERCLILQDRSVWIGQGRGIPRELGKPGDHQHIQTFILLKCGKN
ncbi:hypothetical protein TURU_041678 [Turdus rufiventris]|nr:hypothetical protein TURU_041678 [Turdus rufiventris]